MGFRREAESGLPVAELCCQHGFSEASDYLWRSKFGSMSMSDAKRLKELETENGRLSKLKRTSAKNPTDRVNRQKSLGKSMRRVSKKRCGRGALNWLLTPARRAFGRGAAAAR